MPKFYLALFHVRHIVVFVGIISALFHSNARSAEFDFDLKIVNELYSNIESFVVKYKKIDKNLKVPEITVPKKLIRGGDEISDEEIKFMKIALELFLRETTSNNNLGSFFGIYQKKPKSASEESESIDFYPSFNYVSKKDDELYVFTLGSKRIESGDIYAFKSEIGKPATDWIVVTYLHSLDGKKNLSCHFVTAGEDENSVTDGKLIHMPVCIDPYTAEIAVFDENKEWNIDKDLSLVINKIRGDKKDKHKNKIKSLLRQYIMRNHFSD